MKLYKFKGGGEALHTLDIAMNERLYCARYGQLNDPFEGQYQSMIYRNFLIGGALVNTVAIGGGQSPVKVYGALDELDLAADQNQLVCSLTTAWYDVRMWALYGDSSRGVAFEFEVDEHHPGLHQVQYLDELPHVAIGLLSTPTAADVLSRKTKHWEYEKEWRFISASEYVKLPGMLRRVLIGSRAPEALKTALIKLAPWHSDVYTVMLDHAGVQMKLGHELRPSLGRPEAQPAGRA
ncbi:DUF2971 family protein [Stenotrophomonas rhizophila]|uniref:DUF2971 domain-containing protein n=1 Tax=Stenotrophomonas rhizophila TaxID=216778 RepID=UPI000F4BB486|nr:DUF2971 domain-containing protein [Stenotrophomonas rhizophila]ROP73898.1 DUF2971 family protein [Stenotrophomonas rhizophila]